ncbi:plasmolipin-like [Montipora capricornis]|uniref:plasmolipin-like n=1 Tax=Montipora foliosa TaxID=591990 RepID=UPI0035F19155
MADQAESDPSSAKAQNQSSGSAGLGLTMSYIKSIPGILKMVEFFTLLLAFAIASDAYSIYHYNLGKMDFFLFVTVTSWIFVIAIFILFAFNIISKINFNLDWNILVLVFAVVVAILLLISSALLASFVGSAFSGYSYYDKIRAAAAFGFISMFVFIGDAVLHFLKMRGKM